MNKDNMNNITNINEYRENIMPDTSAININNATSENVEEFVSEEFINSYLNATNQNTPDLWSRIEAGFEKEAKDIVAEQRRRSARTKKVVGFVAAAALITIIALPVMMSGMFSEKEESIRAYDMDTESATMAEEEIYYDESSDSVAMEAPSQGDMESIEDEALVEGATEAGMESDGVVDSTEASPPTTNNSNSITTDQGTSNNGTDSVTQNQLKEIEGVQTDERQLVVEGEFLFDGNSNEVSFKIKAISDNQYNEFVIDIGDKITLSNSMYVLTMDVMLIEGKITLDSVKVDEVGNITGRIINLEYQNISIEKKYR